MVINYKRNSTYCIVVIICNVIYLCRCSCTAFVAKSTANSLQKLLLKLKFEVFTPQNRGLGLKTGVEGT